MLSTARKSDIAAKLESPADAVLVCGDNLTFMPLIPDESVQLVVTSPPYNIGKAYASRIDMEAFISAQNKVIGECVRVLRPTGSICWQVGNHVADGTVFPLDCELYAVFRGYGLQLRNRIIWHFGHGLHCKRRLSGRYETINWWTKTPHYTFNLDPIRVPSKYPDKRHFKGPHAGELSCNPLGKNPSDIWEFPNVKNNHVEKTIHPCQFPVELVERLVLAMTDEGDAVLDPYMGVGTSVVAALMHGRRGYGCDIVREYVDIAENRLGQLRNGLLRTRPMGKPVYDPAQQNGGHEAFVPRLTREDRRSLALHERIADRLRAAPAETLARARASLLRMRGLHPGTSELLDEWERLLNGSADALVDALVNPGLHYRDLRHVTPFAGVLNASERTAVYREFRRDEMRR